MEGFIFHLLGFKIKNNTGWNLSSRDLASKTNFGKNEKNTIIEKNGQVKIVGPMDLATFFSPYTTRIIPESVARVPVSLWGSGG